MTHQKSIELHRSGRTEDGLSGIVDIDFDTVRRQIIKRKINFLVKICRNINSIGAAVAIKYAVDELEILKRLMYPVSLNGSYTGLCSFCYILILSLLLIITLYC